MDKIDRTCAVPDDARHPPVAGRGDYRGDRAVRRTVRPFTDYQIELVTTFADQAVIAIENVRLFEELTQVAPAADRDRRCAQGHQPLDVRLADGAQYAARVGRTAIRSRQGSNPPTTGKTRDTTPQQVTVTCLNSLSTSGLNTYGPGRGGVVGRVLLEGKSVHVPDVLTDPEYTLGESARLGNFRTILGVPLLREGIPIGLSSCIALPYGPSLTSR